MENKIRVGDYIYNIVGSLHFPYWAIGNICGKVKQGINGEFIEWWA